jgi:dolichol-phosphate mannosyltransferase
VTISEMTDPLPTPAPPADYGRSVENGGLKLSVVIPFFNEEENVAPLLAEVREVCGRLGVSAEVIAVDDGSSDGTGREIDSAAAAWPAVRPIHFVANQGQAAALYHGMQQCRGDVVVTMDGDGQNDPHDIPRLLDAIRDGADLAAGVRARRRDSALRIAMSRLANGIRSRALGDGVRDTGCTLKAFRREVIPSFLPIRTMYSFMVAMAVQGGYSIREVEVNHRPRTKGQSKYGVLVFLWRPLVDMLGLMWFFRRRFSARIQTRP